MPKGKKPESYLKRMEQLKKIPGAVLDEDIFDQEKKKYWERLPSEQSATSENIVKKIEQNKKVSKLIDEARERQVEEAAKIISEKKPVGQITKYADDAYKRAAALIEKPLFKKIASKLGSRTLKAVPILGTGLGLYDAAQAASEGNLKKAGLEALSAIDPTPLTDLYLAGQDIADVLHQEKTPEKKQQQKELQEIVKPMIKEVGGEPDIRPEAATKMQGEQSTPDKIDEVGELSRENYEKMLKRKLGY